jgi:predicted dehydrogenase
LAEGPVTVGVVGLGYWGPNLARNLAVLDGCELRWCCDAASGSRERWRSAFPGARFAADLGELLSDPELDAVVIATDVPSHARLATEALRAGKHCFVEKPLAQSTVEAAAVAEEAAASGRVLMVGHLLEYHPGVG